MVDTTIPVALSRQDALKRELALVAHNLANVSTTGFRAERMLFDQAMHKAGSENVAFVVDRASYLQEAPGQVEMTHRDFDVALDGDGWFSVETEDGLRYTRDGRFHMSPDGMLVTAGGHAVLDEQGSTITIDTTGAEFSVAPDGEITLDGSSLGRMGLIQFGDDQRLMREASGLYRPANDVEGEPATQIKVLQGALERSNVDPILEITRLIEASRAYETAARSGVDTHNLKRSAVERLGRAS